MYPDAGKLRSEVYPLPLGFIVIHLILSGCIASFAKRALGIWIEDWLYRIEHKVEKQLYMLELRRVLFHQGCVCVCVCVYLCVCVYVYMYVLVCVCVYVCKSILA